MEHPFASPHGDLSGDIAVKLTPTLSLNEFCTRYIPGYDIDRFDAVAVRMLWGKEMSLTIYALDKHHPNADSNERLPVKKFKLENDALKHAMDMAEEVNFTLTTGKYNLSQMEVINK